MMFGENVAEMETSIADRISELPEFILHNILSTLDTKEAGRASVLSKRWYQVWSCIPVLDFRLQYYKMVYWDVSTKYGFNVDDDVIQSFLGFIDKTMQRYDTQKYRIRKLHLELPTPDKKIESLVDRWIRIAVQNLVQELSINTLLHYTSDYRLPEILFRAKSLNVLKCRDIVLPYYETMELVSLEYLTLIQKNVDMIHTDMLQRIISFCPLVEFITTTDLGNISLPWERKQSKFKTSPLRKFVYGQFNRFSTWPLEMNVVVLKNLRKLEIICATITDDIVSELLYGLVALESLVLDSCSLLECIMISSVSLKELRIKKGLDLMKVTIDAPNLIKFWYNCEVNTSLSLIRVLDHCDAQFSPLLYTMEDFITTDWFFKLKKILEDSKFFQSLVIDLPSYLGIDVEEDRLRTAVTDRPYKLRELKLHEPYTWDGIESPLMGLDGLFWICHPGVLSITTSLKNSSAESILDILKCKVQSWKHSLKSIEVEDIHGASCHPWDTEFRFRLLWL
ncbi:uncharacterized protein LOC141606214 [Silene latifolia]|uniref:uncharacterized protein LOC141606214 n=1 Tax=Silene latifolia TaxID=37657 RepID=UPI003D76B6B8